MHLQIQRYRIGNIAVMEHIHCLITNYDIKIDQQSPVYLEIWNAINKESFYVIKGKNQKSKNFLLLN